jgi:hypothetical protein
MPRKGSKVPYKPKKEYVYTLQDVACLAGMTRNALNVARAHGKLDLGDFGSVVTFLTRRIIQQRLSGNLFVSDDANSSGLQSKKKTKRSKVARKKFKKIGRRK